MITVTVTVTVDQLTALCRFNRHWAVNALELTQESETLNVHAILRAGKNIMYKDFRLNKEGGLVTGGKQNASGTPKS